MIFSQFRSVVDHKASGFEIEDQTVCYGNLVQQTTEGVVLVNRKETLYGSLEEAVDSIKHNKIQEDIQRQIQQEVYEEMSNTKIAEIIKAHHKDVRVTDTLIESFVELASSKIFTTDPVAQQIRHHNKLDRLVEGRVDFVLSDGTTVVISEETQQKLNTIFGQHPDVVEYMRENSKNFLSVLDQIEE